MEVATPYSCPDDVELEEREVLGRSRRPRPSKLEKGRCRRLPERSTQKDDVDEEHEVLRRCEMPPHPLRPRKREKGGDGGGNAPSCEEVPKGTTLKLMSKLVAGVGRGGQRQ